MLSLADVDVNNQRVLIRADLNVPIDNGQISNNQRLLAVVPTIKMLLERGASVMVMSHLGRPKEGNNDPAFSLAPVADALCALIKRPVRLEKNWLSGVTISPGEVVMCENVRFNVGEKANSPALARCMASLCDVFVMDAFGTAHRAHASTTGIAHFAKAACAGPLLIAELEALERAFANPEKPVIAIVGGAKVSTKLTLLDSLLDKVDQLILGGGICNTFLAACGYAIGKSLFEPDLVEQASQLLAKAQRSNKKISIPSDVVVADAFSKTALAHIKPIASVTTDDMILDLGPKTMMALGDDIASAKTLLWNGPVGVFEFPAFQAGTKALAQAVANSEAFSIAGGGDTIAAIEQFGVEAGITYISTGGGAFLTFLEGNPLPAVQALVQVNQ